MRQAAAQPSPKLAGEAPDIFASPNYDSATDFTGLCPALARIANNTKLFRVSSHHAI